MTDQGAIVILEELVRHNENDELIVRNRIYQDTSYFDIFYQNALKKAIEALNERIRRNKNEL